MSKTIGKASLEADEKGLVSLQCDRCKSRFKMECSYLNDELEDNEICCPICGISEKLNTFLPKEVIEEAQKIAIAEAERMFVEAFKGVKSKHIKIKTKSVQRVDTDIAIKNKDYDMLQVKVNCCDKTIGLMSSDITAGFYCPYCGRIIK
jgi:hydrogenase maturation factor HypF (carbamoyltransferase family)